MIRRLPERLAIVAILFAACSVSAFDYSIGRVDRQTQAARQSDYRDIVDGVAKSPFRYRVLVPAVTSAVMAAVEPFMPVDAAFRRVSGLLDFAALIAMLWALYRYLCLWFSRDQALVGVLMIGCTLPISLRNHLYAPYSLWEPTLLTAGLLCIVRDRLRWLPFLTIAASLNRETGVLLPLACLLSALDDTQLRVRRAVVGGLCLGVWVATLLLLRWQLGAAESAVTISAIWSLNSSREGVWSAVVNVSLFAGVAGWALAILGFARAPRFVRLTGWLLLIYLPVYFVWGVWYEVRLLMPLYPIILPAMLSSIYEPTSLEFPGGYASGGGTR